MRLNGIAIVMLATLAMSAQDSYFPDGALNKQGIFLQLFSWDSRCLQVRLEEAQDLLIGINLVLS
jgi:hypothetical protein